MASGHPLKGIAFAVAWGRAPFTVSIVRDLVSSPTGVGKVVSSGSGVAAAGLLAEEGPGALTPEIEKTDDAIAVVDGRLDNIAELRALLHLEAASGAASVLIAGYRRWESELLPQLRGEFAFVIWDDRNRRVLAARDPFGVRLLHYVERPHGLWIATDADQFVRGALVAGIPDDSMVVEFLTRDFRSRDRSFIKGVSRLPGGHGLIATAGGTRTFDYRRLPSESLAFGSKTDCYAAFRDVFELSVRRRLSSRRATLLDLSGGYDSSSIVCVADRIMAGAAGAPPRIVAASAVFPGLRCDESEYIDAVARRVRMPVEKWDGTRATASEFDDTSLAAPGERMSISGGTQGYIEIARAYGADAVVSGVGGDHIGIPMGLALDRLASGEWRAGLRIAFPRGISAGNAASNAAKILGALLPSWSSRLRPMLRAIRRPPPPLWLTAHARTAAPPHLPEDPSSSVFASHGQRGRWRFLEKPDLGFAIEHRARRTARAGLELRLPFVDWDVVAFALAVPVQYWPEAGISSRFHAEALRTELPSEVYLRRSKGEFTSAVVNAAVKQIPAFVDMFCGQGWASGAFVAQTTAQQLLSEFRDFPTTRSLTAAYRLRALASVEAWLRMISRYSSGRPPE